MKRPLSTKTVGPETPGAWVWAKREAMLKLVPGMGDSCQRESAPPPCVYGGGGPLEATSLTASMGFTSFVCYFSNLEVWLQ